MSETQSQYKKNVPLLSIITVTLENYIGLQETEKSIEKQSFNDYEWIVVDGKSTDNTIDFLREKRSKNRTSKYPFQFISEQDDGIFDAMNKGIRMAKGKYLIFLNAGDRLASADILKEIAAITKEQPDFIYGDSLEEDARRKTHTISKTARSHKDIVWGMFTHHQAMIYNRLTIRKHKMHYSLMYKISGDYDFTVRFLKHSKKVKYIRKPICFFEPGGISQQNALLGRKEQYIIRDKLEIAKHPLNLWVFSTQTTSFHLKSMLPSLYYSIKMILTRNNHQKT